jgi:hypothetical protein
MISKPSSDRYDIERSHAERHADKIENKIMSEDLKVWQRQSILMVWVSFLADVCP